jgi:hypothetical protein
MMTTLAERMTAAVAPKVTAQALCSCREVFCYCRGIRLYTKSCCYTGAYCTRRECGSCRYVGNGC